ncbi:Endoglucanase EG-II [Cadophora malorum]|uniref:Endoglucanase EG-II n=1 Tax=Cadophora malorum TaxID=108018 RepID=A0A8H8BWF6_9HELO|nr:Endoglucanase EG-II [Cadophora malorum]
MKISSLSSIAFASIVSAQQTPYGQCGGIGWSGATTCTSGWTCKYGNEYYSQCLPGSSPPVISSSTRSATSATTSAPSASATSKVKYAGVNIAGFDFGCLTDGSQTLTSVRPPLSSLGGPDGLGQIAHFIRDDHMNVFRLPVGWQFLVNNNLGGTLDATNLAKYDQLVQGCLSSSATTLCIIDIHNYARWNGGVIGQGGPTDEQFVSLWTQLAAKYKGSERVVFGLMNEPHDVDIARWAVTVQAVVTAIRNAGATAQMLLLPGNDWTSAGAFISNGSGAALLKVKNPDGSTTGLIFDVHKYLDSDNSGTHAECVTDNVAGAFQPLATWLRANGRQAMLTETGGGNVASCVQYMCSQVAFLNANSDVYLGYVGWSAGSFDSTYVLTETPTGSGSNWQDTLLVKSCLAR